MWEFCHFLSIYLYATVIVCWSLTIRRPLLINCHFSIGSRHIRYSHTSALVWVQMSPGAGRQQASRGIHSLRNQIFTSRINLWSLLVSKACLTLSLHASELFCDPKLFCTIFYVAKRSESPFYNNTTILIMTSVLWRVRK